MRKKLSLNLNALAVESFATARKATGLGTVQAHSHELSTGPNGCETVMPYTQCARTLGPYETCEWPCTTIE